MTIQKTYQWAKQVLAEEVVFIQCKEHDPIKDFRRDPSGYYVLIRTNNETKHIEVAICDKKHQIKAVFMGKKAQDVYEEIFQYEKKHQLKWFDSKGHCAYLGKELKKAEFSLHNPQEIYVQE
jgi:hypothetical protein